MSLEQRLTESITEAVERTPVPTFALADIRRRAGRRIAGRAAAATAGVVVVVSVVSLAGTRMMDDDGAPPPVNHPTSTSTPSPSPSASAAPNAIPDVRDKQVVVTWNQPPSRPSVQTLLGRATSDDLGPDKGGEVSVTGPVYGYMDVDAFGWKRYCVGAPHTWWVFTVQPQMSFSDLGRCDGSGQPTSAPPPESLDGPLVGMPRDLPGRPTNVEVRMFLTATDPTAYLDCVNAGSTKCIEPRHAAAGGARFGVELYAREPAKPATTIFGSEVYPAARVLDTTYTFTTAVAAATGSRLLTYQLPPSTRERIVQAMAGQEEPCRHTDGQRSPGCMPAPKLRIDGQSVENGNDSLFTSLGARAQLAPGGAHKITLAIPASDTRELDLGFVVFQARDN